MDYSRFDWEVTDFEKSPDEIAEIALFLAQSGVGGVCVPPFLVKSVSTALRGLATHTVAKLTSLHSKATIKAIETVSCIKDGADRVEVPINDSLLRHDSVAVRSELLEVARAARAARHDVILAAQFHPILVRDKESLANLVLQAAFDEVICPAYFSSFDGLPDFLSWTLPSGLRLKYTTQNLDPEKLFQAGAHRVGVWALIPKT